MKLIVPILVFLFLATVVVCALYYHPVGLKAEYTTQISVDSPDKIENAISNVLADLGKRDFVSVDLWVRWYPGYKTYVVYARGIDRTKLSNYEP